MTRAEAFHTLHGLYNKATPEQQEALNIAQRDIEFVDLMGDYLKPVRHEPWNIIEWDKENKRVMVECGCGAVFKLPMFDFGLCYNYCPSCGARKIEEKEEC